MQDINITRQDRFNKQYIKNQIYLMVFLFFQVLKLTFMVHVTGGAPFVQE